MPSVPEALCKRLRVGVVVSFLAFFLPLFPGGTARADFILNLNPAILTAGAGDTLTFTGTITNTTGVTLNATDMFLNFSGYDPSAITNFTQLLGTPDFVLPDHRISPLVSLFSVTIAPTASSRIYSFDVILQDINNDTAPTVTGNAQVGAVPEPSAWLLSVAGVVCVILYTLVERRKKASEWRAHA